MPRPLSSLLDRVAITLSGLCLIHCMAGALLLSLFAVSGDWLSHNVHLIGLMMALPLAAIALWRGVRIHGRVPIAVLGATGIALMAASLFLGHGESAEIAASMLGVSLLGAAHWWNMRASRV